MKKFFCILVGLIICLSTFSYFNLSRRDDFATANFFIGDDEEINRNGQVINIVSTDKDEILFNENDVSFDNISPFNTRTETLMGGYSFTPKTNNHSEIDGKYLNVTPFTLYENDSIYLWIYFPDSPMKNFYSLTISFYDENNNYLSWFFSFVKLYELSIQYDQYGWKLFELCQNDATKSTTLTSLTLSKMYINYSVDIETYKQKYASSIQELEGIGLSDSFYDTVVKTSGRMSFYHVFATEKQSTTSGPIIHRKYYNFGFRDDFISELNKLFLGDTYKVKKINEMFNYLYVGKYNLLLTGVQNSIFSFTFSFTNDKRNEDLMVGETYKFTVSGGNYFVISVSEAKYGENLTVFSEEISIYIEEYKFGKFFRSDYNIKGEDSYIITFNVSDDFSLSGEVEFKSSNEKIFIIEQVEYSNNNKYCSVKIRILKNGYAKLTANVNGLRDNLEESNYKVTVPVNISGMDSSFFSGKLFWIMFAITLMFILAFIVITIINWKRAKRLYY